MRIQAENSHTIVTIVDKSEDAGIVSAVDMCKRLLMGLGFQPDSVAAQLPDEEELDSIIFDGIKAGLIEEAEKKELDESEEA
jgi:hypothetical protein